MHARGGDLLHGAHLVERGAGQTRAGLGIGRVTARAVHEIGLTRFRQRHEFGRDLAADLAAIGLHLAVIQAAAGADGAVGLPHGVVGFLQRLLGGVETVGVLHDELAGAQKTEARANLITVLRLNLVEVLRQFLVGAQLVAHERHDDLLVGGTEAHLAVVTVGKAHELWAVVVQAAAFLPQLRRLQHRHENLLGTRSIHFLAHDVLDLLQHAEAQGKERVQARPCAACPRAEAGARYRCRRPTGLPSRWGRTGCSYAESGS